MKKIIAFILLVSGVALLGTYLLHSLQMITILFLKDGCDQGKHQFLDVLSDFSPALRAGASVVGFVGHKLIHL